MHSQIQNTSAGQQQQIQAHNPQAQVAEQRPQMLGPPAGMARPGVQGNEAMIL